MARPVYTPKEKIETGLYTSGKEWIVADTNLEYIGLYHRYPNGSVYSEATFNDYSKELVIYTPVIETENGSIYYQLTKKRFNNYTTPEYYFPTPTDSDYKKANIARFFVQQKNNLSQIIEVDGESYGNVNNKNSSGIDAGQYRKIVIEWSLAGPIDEVRKANQRVILNSGIPELSTYLTDLTEFYKY